MATIDNLVTEVTNLRDALMQEERARQQLEAHRQNDQIAIDHLERKVRDLQTGPPPTSAGGKPITPKVTFEGDPMKWYDFRREFTSFQRFVGWTDAQAKGALETCMRGEAHHAISCLDQMAADPDVTCTQLLTAYELRFVPESCSEVALLNFDRAVQGPTETLQSFHGRVRHLYFRAHARPGQRVPEEEDILTHLVKAFTRGIRRKAFRLAVRRAAPTTYNDALQAAQREYAALTGDDITVDQSLFATNAGVTTKAKRSPGEPMDVNALQERKQPNASNPCDVCRSPHHWRRECPRRPQGSTRGRGGGAPGGASRGRGGPSSRGRGVPVNKDRLRYWVQAMEELEDTDYMPEDHYEAATVLAMAEEVYAEPETCEAYEDSEEDLS